ncbi:hypothetical protein [uncultured Paraglaciecola sp.]|uniref:hypothetical protein n=1 Tax=uncultured Paraglaciecola sp. TaxID=1765024 RepID=UPI0030D9E7D7|tara:strand:- start:39056 stop:40012 length:957 start_codon:yes stop_codon:yes gene_type:complete
MLNVLKMCIGCFVISLSLLSHIAYAGVIVNDVTVLFGGGNRIDGGTCCSMYSAGDQDSSIDGSAVFATISDTLQYSGLNASDENDTMTVNYGAQNRITEQGEFKAGVSLSVDNPFYNVQNSPYVLDDNFDEHSVDPNGLPSFLYAASYTYYRNDLNIQSASEVSRLKVDFSIDGWINENNALASSSIDVVSDGDWNNVFGLNPLGSVNNIYADESHSFFIDVINGEARLELEWYLDLEIELDSLLDNISGSIDFLNTMKFGQFTAYDSNMNVINDAMIVGSEGKIFSANAVTSVPAPNSFSLIAFGFLLMTICRKRII